MVDLSSLILFAGTLTIASASPGPSIAALVARVLSRGPKSVLPFLAAMWLGDAIWLTAAVFGLALLAQTFQFAFTALKWAGIAYLLWLAWKSWTAPVGPAASLPGTGSAWRLFGAGLAVTLGNPKIMVFYLALLPSIIDLDGVGVIGWLELTLVMVSVLIVVDFAWVFAAARARMLFRSPGGQRLANRLSGGMMAGAVGAMLAR